MHHINVNYEYQGPTQFTFYPVGDFHIGNAACDLKKVENTIEGIAKTKNSFVILMGDLAENILPNDKRFNADEIHPRFKSFYKTLPTEYLSYLVNLLTPIKDKIITIHDGNHEETLQKYYFRNLSAELAGHLNTKYTPAQTFTKIQFEYPNKGGHMKSLVINTAHGHQAGRSTGSKVNFMENAVAWIDADIILRGHSHSLFANKTSRMGVNPRNSKLVRKEIIVGHTGSALETYTSNATTYAERADYRTNTDGFMKIFIDVDLDEIRLSYLI